jgi:hypothetical protein
MSHFAEIDESNKVTRILVGNPELSDQEALIEISNLCGGRWIQTSYNSRMRKHYAGIDFIYDELLDAFLPPKPFDSWILNQENYLWQAPVAMPTDGKMYNWNETTTSWIEI